MHECILIAKKSEQTIIPQSRMGKYPLHYPLYLASLPRGKQDFMHSLPVIFLHFSLYLCADKHCSPVFTSYYILLL